MLNKLKQDKTLVEIAGDISPSQYTPCLTVYEVFGEIYLSSWDSEGNNTKNTIGSKTLIKFAKAILEEFDNE